MKRARAVATAFAVAAFLTAAAGCGDDDAAPNAASPAKTQAREPAVPDTLRFAVSDLAGLEELKRNLEPFRREMAAVLQTTVEFYPVPNLNAAVAALESDAVDLVLTGPSEYVVMRARKVAEPLVGIRRPGYRAQIIGCEDAGLRKLEQLRGRDIALAFPGGLATHLAPSKMLVDAGLEPGSDVDVELLPEAGPAREACRRGDVAAEGLKPSDYEEFIEQFDLDPEQFPVLATGPLLPPDVIVANPRLDRGTISTLRERILADERRLLQAVLTSGATSDAARSSYAEKYQGAAFVGITDADFDYVRQAFAAIGASDLTEFPDQ